MKSLVAILLFLLGSQVYSSQDIAVGWATVRIGLGPDPEKHFVRAAVRDRQLTELSFHTDQGVLTVPSKEFAGVRGVQLDSLKIFSGQFYGGIYNDAPYVFIELRYGTISFEESPRARFLFHSGAYQGLTLIVKSSENKWQHTEKLPGKPLKEIGTTTQLPASK